MEKEDEKKVLLSFTKTPEGLVGELNCKGLRELSMVAGGILRLLHENDTLRVVVEKFLDTIMSDDNFKDKFLSKGEQKIPTVIPYTQNEYKN